MKKGLVSAVSSNTLTVLYVIGIVIITLLPVPCRSGPQRLVISPGFSSSEMYFVDHNGLFLLSNSSNFAFGFTISGPTDTTSFLLSVVFQSSSGPTVVWTANRGNPVTQSDTFVFGKDGNAYLQSGGTTIWSTNTSGQGATTMELQDTGNLVINSSKGGVLWQSFSYPTDTLLSGQKFIPGMKLVSKLNSNNNLTYNLQIASTGNNDMLLYAAFPAPQPYWSMQQENRKISNKSGGKIFSAILDSSSWNFYDQHQSLLWQFVPAVPGGGGSNNTILAAVLGDDGFLSFYTLMSDGSKISSATKIPQDQCDAPESCGPYYICSNGGRCVCPEVLSSYSNCNPGTLASSCSSNSKNSSSNTKFGLQKLGDGVGYFATAFVSPFAKSNLAGCRNACMANCSCLALFFDTKSGNCFLFDQIGSLQQLDNKASTYSSYIKISGSSPGPGQDGNSTGGSKHLTVVLIICFTTAAIIAALIYVAIRIRRQRHRFPSPSPSQQASSEEDNFLDNITGVPVRFSYKDLQVATDNFSVKLGQGGFGSVYLGKLPSGAQIAVKKLEGIGQGKKEFRAEVTTIGSIHHVHLVKLKGFCAEGAHRLLAYEYLAKGSLDRWIFPKDKEGLQLDWHQRYNIALGTAKGLAYLHEDCDAKIVHCDIKPENVLLDDNFVAKVSDFGLAKLMTREQSHVFTTLRGTRGYLAPEWITNYAISEKSDVYSFGMVLLEIIGGRKNFDPAETSEKAHFPSYAFKKMEEGKLKELFDAKLKYDDKDERVETAIKVALWCIQEDLSLRPSMMKVTQMLEGVSYVPQPPTSSQIGFRLYGNMFKSVSEGGTSSGQSDCNSDAFLSAVRLSGPR